MILHEAARELICVIVQHNERALITELQWSSISFTRSKTAQRVQTEVEENQTFSLHHPTWSINLCVCVFNNKQKLTHRLPAQEGQHKAAFVCLCVSMVTETTEKGTDERRELNGRGGSNGKHLS